LSALDLSKDLYEQQRSHILGFNLDPDNPIINWISSSISQIGTIAPRYLLSVTFPDFDLAPKRKRSVAIANFIWYSAVK